MKGRNKPRREPKKPPKEKRVDKAMPGARREPLEQSEPADRNIPHINGIDEDDGA